MKKIWIVGSLGHMGQALIRLLDMMEYELYETDKDELDITDEHAVSLFMHRNRPDVVINCAGYHPSAGAAQSETDMAYKVNAVGARNLAQSAESIQAKLIQISTDDVFSSASDTPYNEFDDVNPVGLVCEIQIRRREIRHPADDPLCHYPQFLDLRHRQRLFE